MTWRHAFEPDHGATGHGICAELFPEWIKLDDWGYPIIDPEADPHRNLAANTYGTPSPACPTLALLLMRTREGVQNALWRNLS